MMLFDFFKKLFGWADKNGRKRRADDSSNSHEEFVQVKRHRGDLEMGHRLQVFTDFQYSSDEEDNMAFSESVHQVNFSENSSNSAENEKKKSSCYLKKMKVNNPFGKSSQYSNPSKNTEHSTLNTTQRLREKKQYGEMLQNLVPDRIQILNRKVNQPITRNTTPEVIDLKMYKSRNSTQSLNTLTRPSFYSTHPQSLQRTKLNEKTPTIDAEVPKPADKCQMKSVPANKTMEDVASFSSTSSSSKTLSQSRAAGSMVTNSLRDRLSSKPVVKTDFMAITKRYDARIEERNRQAEELKRMTALLAKHNRLSREAALEEQLARSMRLCEAVLEDREEPEEAPLPVLTPGMLQEVRNALVPHPPNQVLVEGFGLQITRKDIHTLSGLNWLNDEVINFYMNLLIVRGTSNDNFPKVHVMNTFFYPKLLSGGHSSLKRWTRKVDIFSKDLLVVPIHLGMHWCMSVADFREKTIRYFDSMGGGNPKCLNALRQYLQDESLDKKKQPYDTTDWKLESVKDIPQQMNGSDCGVFSCMFAEYICANKRLTFSQKDMPYFRNKMVYEILHSKLL